MLKKLFWFYNVEMKKAQQDPSVRATDAVRVGCFFLCVCLFLWISRPIVKNRKRAQVMIWHRRKLRAHESAELQELLNVDYPLSSVDDVMVRHGAPSFARMRMRHVHVHGSENNFSFSPSFFPFACWWSVVIFSD